MKQKQKNKVAAGIKGSWRRIGKHLGFNEDGLLSIRNTENDPEDQAQSMLEQWHSREGEKATVRILIQALKKARMVDVANKVFRDIVKDVDTSDGEDDD